MARSLLVAAVAQASARAHRASPPEPPPSVFFAFPPAQPPCAPRIGLTGKPSSVRSGGLARRYSSRAVSIAQENGMESRRKVLLCLWQIDVARGWGGEIMQA